MTRRREDILSVLDEQGVRYDAAKMEEAHLVFEAAWEYPHGSDDWCTLISLGQRLFGEAYLARKGRRKGSFVDDPALVYMHIESALSGERCARKLARAAIEKGLAPSKSVQKVTTEDRLARKYGRHWTLASLGWGRCRSACLHLWTTGAIEKWVHDVFVAHIHTVVEEEWAAIEPIEAARATVEK